MKPRCTSECAEDIRRMQGDLSRLAIAVGKSHEETAWMIEWPVSDTLPARWWHPVDGWMTNPNHATRFARKEDAEAFIKTGRFCAGMVATEHKFL